MARRSLRAVLAPVLPLAVTLFGVAGPAAGGPTKYDPATRSFPLTYTYAALPNFGMSPEQIEALGELQKATDEQDAKIRALQQAVSQVIFQVTDGRAKIGSLEYVDSIKKADIIVSLTGNPGRAGWAIPGGIEGQPGQVGLYYQNLESDQPQDVVYTAAHELCHYLFALPDEYSNGTECPLQNPEGPGCLMDNYFQRHGFLELCRDESHNPSAPNPGTVVSSHSAQGSCRHWIDAFFEAHPPGPASSSESGSDESGGDAGSKPAPGEPVVTADRPFTGKFALLVDSTTAYVRDKLDEGSDAAKSSASLASKARRFAEEFLKKQLPFTANVPGYVPPTREQYRKALELIVRDATSGRVKPPTRFDRKTVSQLKTKAQELAATATRRGGNLVRMLLTGDTDRDTKPLVDLVKRGLTRFLLATARAAIIGAAPGATASPRLTPEEQKYIEQIARDAVASTTPGPKFSTFQEAALLHIRLSMNATETINAIAGELDLPGIRGRNRSLRDLEQLLKDQLKGYALPGKPFTGFGFRRTYIIAPQPQDPDFDDMRIDAGDHISYDDVRRMAVGQFMRLLQRERVEFIDDPVEAGSAPAGPVAGARPARPLQGANDRYLRQVSLINRLVSEVRRNRVENIVIIAPPGGLSQELGDPLESLRSEVVDDPYSDVRIDLVLLDRYNVPLRLRDLVARTGGIVQSVSDVDEIGAAGQRIKNDLAAGSWVTIPQQGTINLSLALQTGERRAPPRPASTGMTLEAIRREFLGDKDVDASLGKRTRRYDAADDDLQWAILPTFPMTYRELNQLERRLNYFLQYLVREAGRPDSYGQISNAIAGLSDIQRNFEAMDAALKRLKLGDPNEPFHGRLHELLALVDRTKLLVRSTLGLKDSSLSALNDTDDYYDWDLRRTLVAESRKLRRALEEIPDLSDDSRSDRLGKASYLLERATEFDQKLTDLRRNIYTQEFNLLRHPNARARKAAGRDPIRALEDSVRPLLLEAGRLERRQVVRSPQMGCLLTEAARLRETRIEIELRTLRGAAALNAGAKRRSLQAQELPKVLADLEALVRLLDLASGHRLSLGELDERLDALERHVGEVRLAFTAIPAGRVNADEPPAADGVPGGKGTDPTLVIERSRAQLQRLEPLVQRLRARAEEIRNLRAAVADAGEPAACAADEDTPPLENSLSPLRDSMKLRSDLVAGVEKLRSDLDAAAKARKGGAQGAAGDPDDADVLRWLGLSPDDPKQTIADELELRADELIYGDFPLLLLDILGRLRQFDAALQGVEASIHEGAVPLPVFARIKPRREPARAVVTPDGTAVEIEFQPFVAEEGADVELILGLSRPLRNFQDLKQHPPALRFYEDGGDDSANGQEPAGAEVFRGKQLVERPYLGFDPELSTDTMLVYRIPKPAIRKGRIGAGKYWPRVVLPLANLPVLGRDNALDYTFSVGTQRPNVQLIAALRQPQPKVADVDRAKDPEEAFRGTLAADQLEAVVEVQVLAGASITGAVVTGAYQRFDATNEPIDMPTLTFVDDGVFPDLQANDGVYTRRITLVPNTRRTPGEYRLFIQARSADQTAFMPVVEPIPVSADEDKDGDGRTDPDKDRNKGLPKVPPFQRSTSLNFHVSGES